jgi:hypothetical protein
MATAFIVVGKAFRPSWSTFVEVVDANKRSANARFLASLAVSALPQVVLPS